MEALEKFFGVALKGQTYLNMLYLLLAFPLGLIYFIFLTVGLSTGIGLAIIWIGLGILLAVFAGTYGLIAFERWMAVRMLREDIPPMSAEDMTGKTLWQKFLIALRNPVTWKGLLYLFAKFPLGLASFIVLVTFASTALALIAAPFYYQFIHPAAITINGASYYSFFFIDTLPGALTACVFGILLLIVSMHLFNGIAWVSGKFARVMVGNFSAIPAAAVAPVSEVVAPTGTESA